MRCGVPYASHEHCTVYIPLRHLPTWLNVCDLRIPVYMLQPLQIVPRPVVLHEVLDALKFLFRGSFA